eukprot:16601-Alexandrium_andersonii.AAC.1
METAIWATGVKLRPPLPNLATWKSLSGSAGFFEANCRSRAVARLRARNKSSCRVRFAARVLRRSADDFRTNA